MVRLVSKKTTAIRVQSNFVDIKKGHLYVKIIAVKYNFFALELS